MALDWDALKTEYVTTEISLSKLAEKHGVTKGALGMRCSKEKWVDERKRYKNGVITKTLQKHQEQDVKRLCKLMDATDKLIDISLRAINDDQQYQRYIVTEGCGEGYSEASEKVFQKVDTKALKDTVSVLKELTSMVRDFYDLPTAAQREQRDINLARLRMDEKKANREENEDRTITLVIPPELEGLGD